MTTATETELRTFDAARKAQGFESQAHLDAFFAAYDHTSTCPVCTSFGDGIYLDDGWQPTHNRCEAGSQLEAASVCANFRTGGR